MKKTVYIFLFNGYSDWEISYLAPEIHKSEQFDLVYFSLDGKSVRSMGGLNVQPAVSLKELNTNKLDVLILPGGTAWEKGENQELNSLVSSVFECEKPIAAICAATTYLGQMGFLDNLKHTSNDINYLKAIVPSYKGGNNYINTLSASDKNIITANGIAPIEFAREIFIKLDLYNKTELEKWFQLFKNGIWTE